MFRLNWEKKIECSWILLRRAEHFLPIYIGNGVEPASVYINRLLPNNCEKLDYYAYYAPIFSSLSYTYNLHKKKKKLILFSKIDFCSYCIYKIIIIPSFPPYIR